MSEARHCDFAVIGSGPAGQRAAIQAAKAGKRVVIIERERGVGGECVHRGTIPSKTLRESAVQMARLRRNADVFDFKLRDDVQIPTLVSRMQGVIEAHTAYMTEQLERNGILRVHGHARFLSASELEVQAVDGTRTTLRADTIVVAVGSRPRLPDDIPIDHENILDSDSILSLIYLPQSLTVLGGGVIACEYASIFALLGAAVTIVDRAPRPLAFMEPELSERFVESFAGNGGTYLGGQTIEQVSWDGVSKVSTTLAGGKTVESEKMLVALGRTANLGGLAVEAAGLETTKRGLLVVDENYQTRVPHIYAVGDVIGPPGLASSGMAQGRLAVRHALGLDPGSSFETVPAGIFTVPEMSSVGITEEEAKQRHGGARVGFARFDEVARGLVSGIQEGLLKLVADPDGLKLLGVHILGEGATELIHVGQMALLGSCDVSVFVENVFNFPTLAEAYQVAAMQILNNERS